MTDEANAKLSNLCIKYRGRKGISQKALAAQIGISRCTLIDIENMSKRRNIKPSTVYQVLYAIGGDELADSWQY